MENINYENLYKKYKTKYIHLKNSIVLQNGGDPGKTQEIKLEKGVCVMGHYNDLYKNRFSKIHEVCKKQKCTTKGFNNDIILTDGTSISLETFNKFYKVGELGCPKKNTKIDYDDRTVVFVDNDGFIFNVGDKVIDKTNLENVYRISSIYYHPRNGDADIYLQNINKPEEEERMVGDNWLKRDYYIVEPEYKIEDNNKLLNIQAIQNI